MPEIIAELCQNHLGDKSILDEMIAAAAESGADFAKIQSMLSVSELTYRPRFETGLIEGKKTKVIKRPFKNEIERLKHLDLTNKDHFFFIEKCKKYKIKPLTTIFTKSRLDFLKSLKMNDIKISSWDCASHSLITKVCMSSFSRILVSTGATFDREIEKTVKILKSSKKKFCLLHCVSIYPTPLIEAHLNRLKFLKKLSEEIGISDHTNYDKDGPKLSLTAVALGASIVEKHFTILDKNRTKDGIVSANPAQLKELVKLCKMKKKEINFYVKKNIPEFNLMLGKEFRELSDTELLNRDYYQGRFSGKTTRGKRIFNWE
jgi:N,N'-diacetyllegionaminate synthase